MTVEKEVVVKLDHNEVKMLRFLTGRMLDNWSIPVDLTSETELKSFVTKLYENIV